MCCSLCCRLLGAVLSAALVVLLLLAGAVAMRNARRSNADQEESLLYSHIPGTPANAAAAAAATPWAAGKGSVTAIRAASGVTKKLSNLPA